MKNTHWLRAGRLFLALTILSAGRWGPARAETPPPADAPAPTPLVVEAANAPAPAEPSTPEGSDPAPIEVVSALADVGPQAATGGPDAYGYQWSYLPFLSGAHSPANHTGLAGSDEITGPVSLGFSFPFYENSYSQVYIDTNGRLTFGSPIALSAPEPMPAPGVGDNSIAVYWADLQAGGPANTGRVLYQSYTGASNYFVVEWRNVTDTYATQAYTFQVVLRDTGAIEMRYLNMPSNAREGLVGIQDSRGESGLEYHWYNAALLNTGSGVSFTRPTGSGHVMVYPPYQGSLTWPGATQAFTLPVRNTGTTTDTYDVGFASAWPLSLYAADGVTPLGTTNLNPLLDTGAIGKGQVQNVIARISVPVTTAIGDNLQAVLNFTSQNSPTRSVSTTLQLAIPTRFAQAYADTGGAQYLYLAQPGAQQARAVGGAPAKDDSPRSPAIAETPNGDFVYVWLQDSALWYSLLDAYGDPFRGPMPLSS